MLCTQNKMVHTMLFLAGFQPKEHVVAGSSQEAIHNGLPLILSFFQSIQRRTAYLAKIKYRSAAMSSYDCALTATAQACAAGKHTLEEPGLRMPCRCAAQGSQADGV